jgi:hypothetical protein
MPKKRLLISLVLVVLGALIFWKSLSAYQEAKTHLTPASVSVSGYTRRDGTYVRPYIRRPPGGAIHDRPYEDAMFLYSVLMLVGGGLIILPVGMILRGKTQKKLSQESPTPFEISVLLKCASRQHTLRLDSNRFWQKTICPECKVPVDPTRLRRGMKRLSLLFTNRAFIKKRIIPASVILALAIGVTLTVLYLRMRSVESISSDEESQSSPSPAVAVAAPANALNPSAPSVNSSPTASPTNSPSPLISAKSSDNSSGENASATPLTSSSSIPSEVPSSSATPMPETVRYPTGTNLIRPRSVGGRGVLRISNGTSSDAIAKLVDSATNKTRRLVYIQAFSDGTISGIDTGDYILKFSLGTGYIKNEGRFLYGQSYSKFDDMLDFQEYIVDNEIRWKEFEVTLNPVVGGNARTSPISAADFEDK